MSRERAKWTKRMRNAISAHAELRRTYISLTIALRILFVHLARSRDILFKEGHYDVLHCEYSEISRTIPKESATPSIRSERERRLISGSIANLDLRMQDQRQGTQVNLAVFAMQDIVVSLLEEDVSGNGVADSFGIVLLCRNGIVSTMAWKRLCFLHLLIASLLDSAIVSAAILSVASASRVVSSSSRCDMATRR
jgi:hypothetical protein